MLLCISTAIAANAQIGYQVALLSSATGEPRANETVNAKVEITDAKNNLVHSETQSATTNDFGILSLVVGNEKTFENVATDNTLPLYISVTVGGTLIGKSQILSVPVAEVAKKLKSDISLDELCGKRWNVSDHQYITFYKDGTCVHNFDSQTGNTTYEIEGNTIYVYNYWYSGAPYNEWDNDLYILRFKGSKLYQHRR